MRKTLITIVLALGLVGGLAPAALADDGSPVDGTPIPVPAACVPYRDQAVDYLNRYVDSVDATNYYLNQLSKQEDRTLYQLARVDLKKAKIHHQKRVIRRLRAQLAAQ